VAPASSVSSCISSWIEVAVEGEPDGGSLEVGWQDEIKTLARDPKTTRARNRCGTDGYAYLAEDEAEVSLVVCSLGLGAGNGSGDPRRSSYGRGYWLRRCEGFLVETPTKRIGRVAGIRYGERSSEPEVLEVRAGLFCRTLLLISVDEVAEIAAEERRIIVNDPPRLLSE
jgi:hypothetical protein